jgi:glycosyltransferase involved in cell wall biosynthesis
MMSYRPNLVSIIMPAHNGRGRLRQALESVLGQSYEDWELVFVDDGSTDDTAAIARSYSDPRIRYWRQEHLGQAAALNRGLDLAAGEFVTTLDADDRLTRDSLSTRVEKLQREPWLGAVYADGIFCAADGVAIQRFRDLIPTPPEGDVFATLISNQFVGTGAAVLVQRSALESYGIRYDESLVWRQDYDFVLRIAEVCEFGRVPTPAVWRRRRESNTAAMAPGDIRIESLFRIKFRAMESERFPEAPLERQREFFYEFVRNDLFGRVSYQMRVLAHPRFLDFPGKERARLLRYVAVGYLSQGCQREFAVDCIDRARRANPRDLKTQVVAALLELDIRLARRAIRLWATPFVHHA